MLASANMHSDEIVSRAAHASTLDRSPQHMQGYRHAAKAAVEWLHKEAATMNDPNARAILNTAAFGLGVHFKRLAETSPAIAHQLDNSESAA